MFKAIRNGFNDMDKVLLFIMIVLCIFGLFNIVTASSREAVINMDQSIYYFFYKHLASIVLGLCAFLFLLFIPTKRYHYFAEALLIIMVALNLYVVLKGVDARGAFGWIKLPYFNVQPSEIAKPIYTAAIAVYIERNWKIFRNRKFGHWNKIFILCLIGLALPATVFFQRALGTAGVQIGIFGIMFILSPILRMEKLKTIGLVCGVLVFALLFLYAWRGEILTKAQSSRLDYAKPCDRYSGTGYQICNAYIAINLGGLTGVGIGKSTQKYSYIPEPHTDMVFAILAEEYGYIVCVVIIILYMLILWRLLMLSSRASTIRGKYMALGIATYLFLHIFFNLGGLFAIIPLTGVPLPFLSYGGSYNLSLFVMMAMAQRIHMETKRYKLKF